MGLKNWVSPLEKYEEMMTNLAVSVYLGLMSYFIHGVLNNYLDTDKANAPFWGFLVLLVVLDIELKQGGTIPDHLNLQLNKAVSSKSGVAPRNVDNSLTISTCISSKGELM